MSANLARQLPATVQDSLASRTVGSEAGTSQLRYENFRRHYELGPDEKWQVAVVEKLVAFAKLPLGWDGYSAPPVKWDAGMFALNVLTQVMLPRTPAPQIVPSSAGGVQFEWHTGGIDLEFHVSGPYDCELWVEDHCTGTNKSVLVSDDLSDLQNAVRTLTSR